MTKRSITLLFLFTLATCHYSYARDDGQWTANPDPVIHQWFQDVKQPGTGAQVSCCAETDAFEADQLAGDNPDGGFKAVITNGRGIFPDGSVFDVPRSKIQTQYGNPTGHIVIFLNSSGHVLCYVPLDLI